MGKSAFVTSMAGYIAVEEKIPVAIFSLEMSKEQLMQRFYALKQRLRLIGLELVFLLLQNGQF